MKMNKAFLAVLKRSGTIQESGQRFHLDNPNHIWVIESGKVHIFFAGTREDGRQGRLHPLLELDSGQAFFGMDLSQINNSCQLVAIPMAGIRLIQLDREVMVSRGFAAESLAKLITPWLMKLADRLVTKMLPRNHETLAPNSQRDVTENAVILPDEQVQWFRCHGGAYFADQNRKTSISSDQWVPVTDSTWLTTIEPGLVETIDPERFMDEDDCWEHISRFNELFLSFLPDVLAVIDGKKRDYLLKCHNDDLLRQRQAISSLANSAKLQAQTLKKEFDQDPLFTASQIVANYLGLKLKKPTRYLRFDDEDPLGAITRSSAIRTRQVVLNNAWWKDDNGPLLAFLKAGGRPVALLPKRYGYEWVDPVTLEKNTITPENAELFKLQAHQFYRPLPDGPITWMVIFRYILKGIKRELFIILLMGIAGGLIGLILPHLTGLVFDRVIPDGDLRQLTYITLGLIISGVSTALFSYTRNIASLRVEGRTEGQLQAAVWDRLLKLPTSFFKQYSSGDLSSRVMGIGRIRAYLSESLVMTLISSIFSVFNIFLLLYYSRSLALVAVGLVCFAALPAFTSIIQIQTQRKIARLDGKLSGFMFQMLKGIGKLRVSGAETRAFGRWSEIFSEIKTLSFRSRNLNDAVDVWRNAFPRFSQITIYGFMILVLTEDERLSVGIFLAFQAAFTQFQTGVLSLLNTVLGSLTLIPIMERLQPIFTSEVEVDKAKTNPGRLSGNLAVANVDFQYEKDGPMILDNVSLKVKPGEFLAIVGTSGSGKSTLLRLLLGFDRPQAGAVYYDGKELSGLDIRLVRRQFGVVLQHSQLFTGTIFSNIVGTLPLSIEDAWRAAELAEVAEEIEAMPMGMQTLISEGGSTLSGGQRQRILIARALVTTPRYLFFDEATSALDNATQAAVSEALENLHVTRIVVAHRLSTIRHADRIMVMDQGKIIEEGNYVQLMVKNGMFANMVRRQVL